jgi:hypothetical protein
VRWDGGKEALVEAVIVEGRLRLRKHGALTLAGCACADDPC